MTLVRVRKFVPSPLGAKPAYGRLDWRPTRARIIEGDPDVEVLPEAFSTPLVEGAIDVVLDPSGATWAWEITEHVQGKRRTPRLLAVPDLTEVNYTDLVEISAATLEPLTEPSTPQWTAYVDGLEATALDALAQSRLARIAAEEAVVVGVEAGAVAVTKAGEAAASASSAAGSAATATTKASAASLDAGDALSARTLAEAARDAAVVARGLAAASAGAAESAGAVAVGARAGAEMARTGAEAARDAAGTFHSTTVNTGAVNGAGKLILTRNDGTTTDAGKVVVPTTFTVGEVITGPSTPGTPGTPGLPGGKGDPGGLTDPLVLPAGADLNNYTTSGTWRIVSGNATQALNFPRDNMGGHVVVLRGASTVVTQTVIPLSVSLFRGTFQRNLVTTWGSWYFMPSQRVDLTAGRAIYTWDEINNRVENPSEYQRLLADHPNESKVVTGDKVKGKLKVTRAFGVGYLKQKKFNDALMGILRVRNLCSPPYVYTNPHTLSHKVTEDDLFVVLGSDGLFDFFSNDEVVQLVYQFIHDSPFGDPAKYLIEQVVHKAAKQAALTAEQLMRIPVGSRRKYHDDVTVVVIILGNARRTVSASTSI